VLKNFPETHYNFARVQGDNMDDALKEKIHADLTARDKERAQNAWVSVLRSSFAGINERCDRAGFRPKRFLVAVDKNRSDVFVASCDAMLRVSFESADSMISGTFHGPIRPPILIFLFDEQARAPLRGLITKENENAPYQLEWYDPLPQH
jgi:hypothetical protein